jgi:hypothetical protein
LFGVEAQQMQMVGRILVSLALIATIVGPVGADWKDGQKCAN